MAMDGQQERKTDKKKRHQQQQQLASLQVLERVTSDEAPAQKKEKKRKTNENATEINGNSSSVDAFEECFSADEKKAKKKKTKKQEPEARCDDIVLENVLQVESVKVFTNYKDAASKKDKKERSQAELCEGIGAMNNEQFHNGGTRMKEKRKHKSMMDSIENGMHSIENGKAPHDQNIRDQDSLQVTVSGPCSDDVKFRPLLSFQNLRVPGNVLLCCKDFQRPSPIQAHAWPFLLDGQDLIGIAATGSGKTLAFGLPALVHVLECSQKKSKPKNPLCLVLSPTRELAQQISEVLVEAGHPSGINTACLYGGSSKKPQLASLKAGAAIVVATPGRLVDLVEEGHCFLQDVSYVVLDEADRMLDLGFEQVVRKLVGLTSKSRQTIMFSATWPPTVHNLSKEFMKENPIKVIVGSQDLAANHAVSQIVEVIDHTARDARLFDLLKEYHKSERNRVLVFVLYKKEAARVESMLQKRGWKVSAVHGDKGQLDRNKAVMSFKDGSCPLLIATDVAARGLDIPDVEYVINYSFPLTTEDYVHRIGRTGRAGKSGIAHTFFTHGDKARAGELINVLKEAGQSVPSELLKFGTSVKKKESKLYGAHFKEVAEDAPKATKITFDSDED